MALALLLLLGQFGSGLFPDSPATEGDVALQEEVEWLLAHPIDVNRAAAREFLAIPWLNPLLACRIVAARDSVGGYKSVDQVRQAPGMTDEVFEGLRPFLRIGTQLPRRAGQIVSRIGADSIGEDFDGVRLLNRFEIQSGNLRFLALQEKDEGELDAFDFLSAGAELQLGRIRVVLGDITAGFGQGLVTSSPHWRSSSLDGPDRGSRSVRLISSALESSYLRGGAVEGKSGRWSGCLLGAYTGRDARLNKDGSVSRLVGSGVHDDSTSLAGRGVVREVTSAASVHYSGDRAGVGLAAEYSKYSRSFVPDDSGASFAGDGLSAVGVNAQWKTEHYELGAEVAGSSGGGLAGSFEMVGGWPDFDSRIAVRARHARFFAPHGRWPSLTNTRERLDASGRLGWHHAGSSVSLSGNTYRDFELDSMPARLGVRLGQELGRFELALSLGRRYRLDQERTRTARAEVGLRAGRTTNVRLTFADNYPGRGDSRGVVASFLLAQRLGRAELGLAAARVGIDGSGVTMYLHEPGAGRIGASFSTDVSCWRLAAGGGARIGRWLRLGLKAGCAWKPQPIIDGAAQLELRS